MEKESVSESIHSIAIGVSAPLQNEKLRLPRLYNALATLHQLLGEGSWVGLYLYEDGALWLGPFQGSPACERIQPGKGVVGSCYQQEKTIFVEDVTKIENYICCDTSAKSEICAPIYREGRIIAILDVDLPVTHDFLGEVKAYEAFVDAIAPLL